MSSTFAVCSTPVISNGCCNANNSNASYNALTVSGNMNGPLSKYIASANLQANSYKNRNCACISAIKTTILQTENTMSGEPVGESNTSNCDGQWLPVDKLPFLINYLKNNGYQIDEAMTSMFNASSVRINTQTSSALVFYVTFNQNQNQTA